TSSPSWPPPPDGRHPSKRGEAPETAVVSGASPSDAGLRGRPVGGVSGRPRNPALAGSPGYREPVGARSSRVSAGLGARTGAPPCPGHHALRPSSAVTPGTRKIAITKADSA